MSPEELAIVCRSWTELQLMPDEIAARVAESYATTLDPSGAEKRARWLVAAVTELVGLLTSPSQLAERARQLAQSLPASTVAPTFKLDGTAWMRAASSVSQSWGPSSEHAWRRAWLLLSDALANESLSPFSGP
jgi:hypothetical protein